jgi:hypothetical protein
MMNWILRLKDLLLTPVNINAQSLSGTICNGMTGFP